MEYRLEAPQSFEKIKQIDFLCLPGNKKLGNEDVVVIDLSRVNFIKPIGVIGVLLMVESILKIEGKKLRISIIPPRNPEVLDYLLKIKFIDALKYLCPWKIPNGLQTSGRKLKPVIPITRFRNSVDVDKIADEMQDTFSQRFTSLSSLLQPCHVVFTEFAINAVEHAESSGGFVLAQQYDYPFGSRLEVAVGDCGIGITKSLRKNPKIRGKIKNDREAIVRVLQGGLSRVDDLHRGYGLNFVKEEMFRGPDRVLTLRSGNGYAILNTGVRPYSAYCGYFPGTLANVDIPC